MTEPILIKRKGTVPDGAGGFLDAEPEQDTGICLMMEVKPRKGQMTSEGFQLHQKPRFTLRGYVPGNLELTIGDLVSYRGNQYALLAPPLPSEDRRQWTLDIEQVRA